MDDLIDVLLDLKRLLSMRPRNLHPEEVYVTHFPPQYQLQTFMIYQSGRILTPYSTYEGLNDSEELWQKMMPLLLKEFTSYVGGIAYDWYHTLHGIVIHTWMVIEESFLKEQSTFDLTRCYLRWQP